MFPAAVSFVQAAGAKARQLRRIPGVGASIEPFRVIRFLIVGLVGGVLCETVAPAAHYPARANPYEPIVVQNVFRLRAELPKEVPPVPPNIPLPVRPSVRVTGFTDICGRSLVLLEVSEPGKELRRCVLAQGERFREVEVAAIDVRMMRTKLNVGGEVVDITFSIAQSTPQTHRSELKLPLK